MESGILVMYLSRCQIFPLPSSLDAFKKEIYDKFSIDPSVQFNLQYYNESWDAYIDLLTDSEIISGKKYRVLLVETYNLFVENPVSNADTSVQMKISDVASSVSLGEKPQFQSPSVGNPVTCAAQLDLDVSSISSSFQPRITSTPSTSFSVITPIRIPKENFSKFLTDTLKEEKPLTRVLRSEFIRTICQGINNKYPSSIIVTDMARLIITEYPYLTESVGSGYGGWRQALRDWFKNMRRLDQSEEVLKMKKSKKEVKVQMKPPDNFKQESSETQELPSFDSRRFEIIHMNLKVHELLLKYPRLFTKQMFREEFCQITKKENAMLDNCIPNFFKKFNKVLYQLLNRKKTLPRWVETLKSVLRESYANQEQYEEELLIYTLPVFFSEDQLALTYSATTTIEEIENSNSSSPHISVIGIETSHPRFYILAEHKVILQSPSIQESMFFVMAAYFILNCKYPRSWTNTLLLLEKVIFQIDIENNKLPPRVVNFTQKLERVLREF